MKTHTTRADSTASSHVTDHRSSGLPFDIPDSSFVIGRSSFVIRHSPFVICLLLLAATLAPAQTVPLFINYQGKVTDSAGVGLGTPTPLNRKVIFRIYDAATVGTLLWTEEQTVTLSGGEFSVLLGQGIAFQAEARPALDTVFTSSGTGRFLQITVDNGDGTINGSDAPITPRQQITSTAYSFRARSADTVASGTDLTLNGSANYGLGWYGTGRTFGGTAIDGPVLYGLAGGALGSYNGTTQTTALRWNATGQVGVGGATLSGMDATSKLMLQGDDSTSPPKQLSIRGNTDANKRLYLGYNTTSNYGALQAYSGVSTATNLVLNEAGGNVGIGNNAPDNLLAIGTNISSAGPLVGIAVGGAADRHVAVGQSTTNNLQLKWKYNATAANAFGSVSTYSGNNPLVLQEGGGNVGISTSSLASGAKLTVAGGFITNAASGATDNLSYNLMSLGGTERASFSVAGSAAQFSTDAVAGDAVLRSVNGGKLFFQNGSAASGMCLSGNNLGLGTTTPADRLHLKGALRIESTSSVNYYQIYTDSFNSLLFKCNLNGGNYAYLNSNTVGLITTSDRRIKKDIEPMKDCLTRLMKLTPSTFRYKHAESDSSLNYGFIAQDVETQFPDLVMEKDGLKRLASAAFEGINARAIQELKQEKDGEVKALHEENSELKNKLAAQDKRIAELEAKDKARDAKLAAIEKMLQGDAAPAARTVSLKKATAAK